jgi:hypothetical protein
MQVAVRMSRAAVATPLLLFAVGGCAQAGGIAMAIGEAVLKGVIERAQARAAADSPRNVQSVKPSTVRLTPPRSEPKTRLTLRVRAYATDDYLSQTPQAEERFREYLDLVSQQTADWIGVKFVLVAFSPWRLWSAGLSGEVLADRLAALDAGGEADLVVGLIGRLAAVPEGEMDVIGRARMLGKHLLLRDLTADADAWVERWMSDASPGVRRAAFQEVYRHQRLALFLHEWAHTLGAIHSLDDQSIMASAYSRKEDDFDRTNRRIIETTLAWLAGSEPRDRAALARSLHEILEDSAPGDLVASERERMLSILDGLAR